VQRLKLILVLTAVLVVVAACSSDEGGGGGAAEPADAETTDTESGGAYGGEGETESGDGAAAGGGDVALTATGNAWSPATISLTAGSAASVTVENADGVLHSFTFEDAQVDQDVEAGQTATIDITAPAAGEYTFVCKYHSSMTGTVTVA
jgi:plastocyanin